MYYTVQGVRGAYGDFQGSLSDGGPKNLEYNWTGVGAEYDMLSKSLAEALIPIATLFTSSKAVIRNDLVQFPQGFLHLDHVPSVTFTQSCSAYNFSLYSNKLSVCSSLNSLEIKNYSVW